MNKQATFTIYQLLHDLPVFGVEVKTFPKGIQEAFDALSKMLAATAKRSYYGISFPGREAISLESLAQRLESVGTVTRNKFLLRLAVDGYQLTVFPDFWNTQRNYSSRPPSNA